MSWLTENLNFGAKPQTFFYARENRKSPTKTEQLLWQKLRNRQLRGFKFRRQHPIKDFIADFYCAERKLVIEIDGEYHNERSQTEYDNARTYEFGEFGITTIRFSNDEISKDITSVLKQIELHLARIPFPNQ